VPEQKDHIEAEAATETRKKFKFDKWMAASLIAIAWLTSLNLELGLALVAALVASWAVATIPRLEPFTPPVLLMRTVVSLYAFSWFVEFYTGIGPWISIPVGLVLVVIVVAFTSDPYYGIKKEKK
jgi:hypothetical protein